MKEVSVQSTRGAGFVLAAGLALALAADAGFAAASRYAEYHDRSEVASELERLEGDLWRLELTVVNERVIPTMLAVARRDTLHRPDLATVEGARVVASGLVQDTWLEKVELQKHRPERLMVPGVDGLSSRRLFFLLEGKGDVVVRYDSLKGGRIEREVRLQ